MMRLISGRLKLSRAVILSLSACVAAGWFSFDAHTQQTRSIADGVFSNGQAARGQQIYQSQCAVCHGTALEGASGPPLAGEGFLANWSGRTLEELVDKTQKTMPFGTPGTLSRQQSADLTAYMLQTGKFRSGQTDLSDSGLAQIVFPVVRSAEVPPGTPGSVSLPPPEGNLSELMRAIHFPNSDRKSVV